MGEKIIYYTPESILGPKENYIITDNSAHYPLSKGIGGMLFAVIVNKAITGTITMFDQASTVDVNRILSAEATSTAETVITTFDAQPDYPRRLAINPGGTTGVDAAYTGTAGSTLAESLLQLQFIGSLMATNDAATVVLQQTFMAELPLQYGMPVVFNNAGQAFEGDAIEMSITFTPLEDEIQ